MQEGLRARYLLAALLLGGAVPLARAVSLGDLEVRSSLGERLDAHVRVVPAAGESIEPSCFSTLGDVPAGLAPVAGLQLVLDADRRGLRLRTPSPVTEPAAALTLRAACPGSAAEAVREYVLLLDPVPAGAAAIVKARAGETFQSLARAMVREAAPRREYLVALRGANPSLSSYGDRDPLPEGSPVVLPDVRARHVASATAPRGPAPAPPPARVAAKPETPAPARAPSKPETPAAARAESKREAPAPAPAPAPVDRPRAAGDTFVLKLSSTEMDLTRSRAIDDRARQRLRERLMVLDADDQVAALLSMRENLKQLESRVAELQLKIATMPPALAQRTAPEVAPAPAASTPPAAPVVEAAPAQAPAVSTPPPPAPVAAPTAPPVEAAKVEPEKIEPPKVEPAPAAAPPAPPKSAKAVPLPAAEPRVAHWWWAVVAFLVLLAVAMGLRIRRRRAAAMAGDFHDTSPLPEDTRPGAPVREEPALHAAEARPVLASDAVLATRLSDDSGALRRRYIEERFPEVMNGTVVLEDANSVIKGARLFYEDGALPRAVELLHFAIEDDPREVKTWLALFEIFRLERLTGEFAELAARFREHHGAGDWWRKVRYFGREIDPGNPLYREDAVATLETIGPREARRLAASMAAVDPIAENWLNAPMDFENEVLANELRNALMAEARISDPDLAPNPMPALRNVEMFTVA